MTMYEVLLAAQLLSEEQVGKPMRDAERQQAAREDAARRRMLAQVKA